MEAQEYWSMEPGSPALQADSLPTELSGKPTQVSCIAGGLFTSWVTGEGPSSKKKKKNHW